MVIINYGLCHKVIITCSNTHFSWVNKYFMVLSQTTKTKIFYPSKRNLYSMYSTYVHMLCIHMCACAKKENIHTVHSYSMQKEEDTNVPPWIGFLLLYTCLASSNNLPVGSWFWPHWGPLAPALSGRSPALSDSTTQPVAGKLKHADTITPLAQTRPIVFMYSI
jgi:hypothetical protein